MNWFDRFTLFVGDNTDNPFISIGTALVALSCLAGVLYFIFEVI